MYIYIYIYIYIWLDPPKDHEIIQRARVPSGAPQVRELIFHLTLRFGVAAYGEEDDGEALALETFHLSQGLVSMSQCFTSPN